MAASEISLFLAVIVFWIGNYLYSLWAWCLERGYIASVDIFDGLLKATTLGIPIIMHIISVVLLFTALKSIIRSFREKDYDIHQMELLFILTPSMTGVCICTLLRMVLVMIENGMPVALYDKYPSLMVIVSVVLLLSFLSILFGVKLFQDMICWNREKSSRIILEKQVSSLQEHMGEMERVYSGIRGMKHDMKNTISLIMQLAAGKEEELQAYLEELNQTMDRLEFRFKTGNAVVDTLLNMKYHEITSTVPDLRMDVEGLQFPEKLFIQSYDIGIILGNALDNAMEACRKLKSKEPDTEAFIRISSFQKRELFFLKMENSFDGRLVRRRQVEFPMTDKADRENHGIGLSMLRSIASYQKKLSSFRTWLYRIATNKIIDFRRKALPDTIPLEELDEAETVDYVGRIDYENNIVQAEFLEKIEHYVSSFQLDMQQIFRLHIYGEQTFQEIAVLTEMPEASVKSKYYRLIKQVRREFYDEYAEIVRS